MIGPTHSPQAAGVTPIRLGPMGVVSGETFVRTGAGDAPVDSSVTCQSKK